MAHNVHALSSVSRLRQIATVAAATLAIGAHAQTPSLNVALYGGSFLDNTKACVEPAFAKVSSAKVRFVPASTSETVARLRAEKGAPSIDVAYMDLSAATQAGNEGLLDTLDKTKLNNYADLYPSAQDKGDHFVGMLYGATAIAYNPDLMKVPPTSWKDLWNPAYKGMVAVGDIAGTSGQQFLIAAARLNGGNESNIDPGFKAVASLRPNVNMFYTQADQVVSLFQQGDIAMAVWYPDRTAVAAAKGIKVKAVMPSEGAIGVMSTLSIPNGSKNSTLAETYIDTVLSPDVQSCFAGKQFVGPTNKKVKLPATLADKVPYGDAVKKLYFPDPQVVNKSLSAWTERWGREVTR